MGDCDEPADFGSYNIDWSYCDMSGKNLSPSFLIGANLTGTNFSGANLKGSKLAGATLTDTNFENANLENVDFFTAVGQPSSIAGATFLRTECPNGLYADNWATRCQFFPI